MMMPIIKKILSWSGGILLVCLTLIVVVVFSGNLNGWGFAAILSGSMEPIYNVGGMVIIQPVDARTLKVGDPISFNLPGFSSPVCHRIISIRYKNGEKYFQTKGDANEEADIDLVPMTNVKGKVIYHIPKVGRLIEIKDKVNTSVNILGKSYPLAIWVILVLGVIFVGLTIKDNLQDVARPEEKTWRDMQEKRNARLLRRRRSLGLH
jgi:signal peptidase I